MFARVKMVEATWRGSVDSLEVGVAQRTKVALGLDGPSIRVGECRYLPASERSNHASLVEMSSGLRHRLPSGVCLGGRSA